MKKTNKFISILLAMAMILSLVPMNLSVSAAPDTDYNGYYKITNAGNLAWFACLVVGDTSQSGITEAEPDAKAVLTADIDITVLGERLGKSWVGIGTAEIPFTGIFDGNGYTIKGLTTDTSLTKSAVATVAIDTAKQGLFGVIGEGGVVRDVIVEGTANLSDTIKYGGICSENNGTIENVLSKITVNGGDNADVFCHTNNGTITNSFTNQTTTVASEVTVVDVDTLASGSVAYALGASFGQTIGTDTQPVHFDGTNKVYKVGDTYTNTEPTYVASVTDKDGNLIGNYETLKDAVKSAERTEGGTLTLLDNIIVTDYQYINSGKFTIDLNGKTLLHETTNTLWVEKDADLTIKDSGVGGTIQTDGESSLAILNKGTLTIESGIFKGDGGINTHGTLTFKDGEVVAAGYYAAITNYGTAYVHNGTFESVDGTAIVNNNDATIYIYDGKFSGYNAFTNFGTAYIEDGEFKGNAFAALSINDGTIEVTGGSFTGTDEEDGFYSGTPYGEFTVYDENTGSLILKGGEFPKGFSAYGVTANEVLADDYYFCDADGKKITVAEDATSIEGYVKVKEDVAASVTDKDGNLIGKYKTFEEAVAVAKANTNSTLQLLDNTAGCYVGVSSPFTLDLNGYTLDMGRKSFDIGSVLEGYDCRLTVTDTSEAKTGKITGESDIELFYVGYQASSGKLTLLNGTVENNNRFGGAVRLENKGAVEIKGGTIKNNESAEVHISKWSDNFEGSVDISGGTFPDGLEIKVNSSEYTSAENYLADLLADGYCFCDADGKKITVADDATSIEGYVQVKEHYVASVIDKDGNLIGNYNNFEEAFDVAQDTANSTITLLYNVTVEKMQVASYGKFIFDLNGKTLFCETTTTLRLQSAADVTIRDSGEGGTIQSNGETSSAIFNYGTLTIEGGFFKGDGGISIAGKLIFKNGEVEAGNYNAIRNDGTAYIENGKFESENDCGIKNVSGTVYIYDGDFSGRIGIQNYSTTYLEGGKITGKGREAICLSEGMVEVTGGSFTGTDTETGTYTGTPYGEFTVYDYGNGSVILKGGEFPNGFGANGTTADSCLADGCFWRDKNSKLIEVAANAKKIEGYVKVVKGINILTEADITLSKTEFEFTGKEIIPEIKILIDGIGAADISDFLDIVYENNTNAGTATVTISCKEDSGFTGKVIRKFTILPKKVEVNWIFNTIDADAPIMEAYYYDVNNVLIALDVENGKNTEPGIYTASVVIEDANYVAENLTRKYTIYGDKSLSGTVTSFGSKTDEVTLLLYKAGDRENAYVTTVTGNSAEYVFEKIAEGEYILEVSKNNHATRTYEVTVSAEGTVQDAKIHLLGDINGDGKVMLTDYASVLRHVKKSTSLEGYALACADVDSNGRVMITDYAAILRHVKKTDPLW